MAEQNQQNPPAGSASQKPAPGSGMPPPLNLPTKENPSSGSGGLPPGPSGLSSKPAPPPTPFLKTQNQVTPLPPLPSRTEPLKPAGEPFKVPPPPPLASTSPVIPGGPGAGQPLKSSIRTMEEDLNALKKGQVPVGLGVQKPPEKSTAPSAVPPPPPVAGPFSPRINVPPPLPSWGLKPSFPAGPPSGKPETPKPPPLGSGLPHLPTPPPSVGAGSAIGKTSRQPVSDSGIKVPESGSKISSTGLIITLGVLVIVGFSVWFFLFYKSSAPDVSGSPTPVTTVTPFATPLPPLETVFSKVDSLVIGLSDDFFVRLGDQVNAQSLPDREPSLYKVGDPATSGRYSLTSFSDGTMIKVPAQLISTVEDTDLYLTLMRKSDGKTGYGFIVKINNPAGTTAALREWEKAMASNLSKLFNFTVAKAATLTFIENNVSYSDVSIRYRNFPDPNLTIDYAIIPAPNGESYLSVTNSREHIFGIIERIRTITP